jgi:hypothetical protein
MLDCEEQSSQQMNHALGKTYLSHGVRHRRTLHLASEQEDLFLFSDLSYPRGYGSQASSTGGEHDLYSLVDFDHNSGAIPAFREISIVGLYVKM